MADRTCSVDGCAMAYRAKGYCGSHYNRFVRPEKWHAKREVRCAACGAAVEKYATARRPVCSYRCRSFLRFGRWPEDGKAIVHVGPAARVPRPAWNGHELPAVKRVFVQGACEWCGDGFTAVNAAGGSLSRFCTKRCSRRFHAARRGPEFRISPVARRRIYERDGWTCQLCMEPVDRDAHYLDDWAPSLDHVVCQSWALVPDHSESNLRTAHRWCNAVRGDERYYSVADLAA